MDHFWKNVPGFFTFPEFYSWLADAVPYQSPHVVEVGVHEGQSAAYLAVELYRESVSARLDLVDHFGAGVERVRTNLAPVAAMLQFIQGNSWDAAAHYADHSLDAVFIDADHAYESVSRDIDAWRPKVKRKGILAGHDFTLEFPGVIQAVTERFDRFDIWRGVNWGGDQRMQGKYYPVWCVRIP